MGNKIYTASDALVGIPVPAIVESSTAQLDLEIGDAWHALRLAEQREQKTTEKANTAVEVARKAREEAARQRHELGRLLVEKRKQWPARGPKARGWGEFLEKVGIEMRTAERYMELAGYVAEVSDTRNDESEIQIPTYADAGIDKRPRKSDEKPDLVLRERDLDNAPQPIDASAPSLVAAPERSSGRGKPEWLMRALVRHYTTLGDLVCDPFAGWGSTLRAALDEGRQAIGSEIVAEIAAQAGQLPIVVGDWRTALAGKTVDAIICDPPYSERTHAAATTRSDGSDAVGLTPTYAAWTPDDVAAFVSSWSPRCRGWMVALTDSELIPAWRDAYREAGRYAFAPIPVVIKGMSVRISGDGPSSWCVYAMVARPSTEAFVKWGTLPGAYVGTKGRDLFAEAAHVD